MRWPLVTVALVACGGAATTVAPPAAESSAADASWPLTRGEERGQTYLADPIVDGSRACASKSPIELRVYTTDIGRVTVRLAVKNCTAKEVRLLHDAKLQPSELALVCGGKTIVPTDERAHEKFDRTPYAAAFIALAPGEERVLEESYFVSNQGAYDFRWLSFHHTAPTGTCKIQIRFRSALAEGYEAGKRTKVDHAWIGSVASNAIEVHLP